MKINGLILILLSLVFGTSSLVLILQKTNILLYILTGFYTFNFEPFLSYLERAADYSLIVGLVAALLGVLAFFIDSLEVGSKEEKA